MLPITKTSQFPKTFMASRKYLRSLSGVNKEDGKIYTTILIGHDLPSKEIQDCMREWATAEDHFFFERTVQSEQVVTVAWGYGSPSNINSEELANQLMERINAKFQIGCKDRFIVDGSKWTKNPAPKDLNRKAMHFEAPEANALELYQSLVSIYGSTHPISGMPYMLDLKIIPDWTSCKQGKLGAFGTDMLMNCQQMILKQGLFRKQTKQFPVSDIGLLDQPLEGVPKTLREVIMEITVTNSMADTTTDERLFHSILPRKGGTNHQLTYPKIHAATAVAMITGLIPFCLHHYGNVTKKWFRARALNGSSGSKWDVTSGTVINPNDKVVQDGLASKFWWMQDTLAGVKDNTQNKPTRPVGINSNIAGKRMSTGSQVTFSKNMETTHNYNPSNTAKDISISSDGSSSATDSSDAKTDNKAQATGSSTSEEESSNGCGSGSDSEAVKLLLNNPKLLQQILAKASKQQGKPKGKTGKKAAKVTPPKPKKAGSPSGGSGGHN
jgi:hypothetical protein